MSAFASSSVARVLSARHLVVANLGAVLALAVGQAHGRQALVGGVSTALSVGLALRSAAGQQHALTEGDTAAAATLSGNTALGRGASGTGFARHNDGVAAVLIKGVTAHRLAVAESTNAVRQTSAHFMRARLAREWSTSTLGDLLAVLEVNSAADGGRALLLGLE